MSRNLINLIYNSQKKIFYSNSGQPLEDMFIIGLKFTVFMGAVTSHFVYTLSTSTEDKFAVIKKYKMVRNGFTDFMIIDDKGRHFNINNSLWFWKWNSIEDWHNIKEGDELNFKYYGWRIPLLGFFPNIYMTSKDNFCKKTKMKILDYVKTPDFQILL